MVESLMAIKGEQLQIRTTTAQKAALKRAAAAAGLDVSSYVLSRALPSREGQFEAIVQDLADATDHRFALAALNDLLTACPPVTFAATCELTPRGVRAFHALTAFLQNYVAAMIEQAAHLKAVAPPDWTREVAPLPQPWFASTLRSLRQHLLVAAPVAFKRRNLFVDATIGDRA